MYSVLLFRVSSARTFVQSGQLLQRKFFVNDDDVFQPLHRFDEAVLTGKVQHFVTEVVCGVVGRCPYIQRRFSLMCSSGVVV